MIHPTSSLRSLISRITTAFLAAVILASYASTVVLAADNDFYAGNDIILYDKNAVACSTNTSSTTNPSNVTGSDIAEKVFNFLTSTTFKGLDGKAMNAVQAAGALGNFQHESGMNPAQKQIGGGGGRGLAQWDDRAAALFAFADSKGKPWTDLDVQLQFIKKELDGSEGTNLVSKGFMTVSTPEDSAFVFEAYERAGVKAYADRKKYAVEYYARFGGTVTNTKITNAFVGGCRYSGNGPVGDYMDNSAFTSYSQCSNESNGGGVWGDRTDSHGQTMCNVGCGPTSLAMVIRNMTGSNVTPEDMRKHYNENKLWASFGSGPDAQRSSAEKWGLRTEDFDPRDLDAYKKIFASGGLAIVGGQGAEPFYAGFGHYVVVRGITEDGKFRVSDPGRGYVKDYDINTFMAGASRRVSNATAFYSTAASASTTDS